MKIVIDTNVIASSIFFGGKPKELIDLVVNNKLDAYVTKEIVEEYEGTVNYLKDKYRGRFLTIPLKDIISSLNIIKTTTKVNICRDKDDNKFLNCAIDSNSLYIVSGDKDLLVLGEYEKIKIITVANFLENYKDRLQK